MRTLVIVRRGAVERFRVLQETFAEEPVEIMWDRRAGDRRQRRSPPTTDRRRRERRGPPPVTWTALDFVMLSLPDRQEDAPGASAL